jgi:hypothetical protein
LFNKFLKRRREIVDEMDLIIPEEGLDNHGIRY